MSPTITVASFFFVRQNVCVVDTSYRTTKSTEPASGITSELLQRVPPFVYSIFNVRYKTGRDYRVPPLNFFRHCATFFFEFSFVAKRSPLQVFWYFAANWSFKKPKGSPLSSFSALWDFQNSHFSFFWIFFKKFSKFFFCRQTVPPSSFLIFCSKLKFQKAQRVPPL